MSGSDNGVHDAGAVADDEQVVIAALCYSVRCQWSNKFFEVRKWHCTRNQNLNLQNLVRSKFKLKPDFSTTWGDSDKSAYTTISKPLLKLPRNRPVSSTVNSANLSAFSEAKISKTVNTWSKWYSIASVVLQYTGVSCDRSEHIDSSGSDCGRIPPQAVIILDSGGGDI